MKKKEGPFFFPDKNDDAFESSNPCFERKQTKKREPCQLMMREFKSSFGTVFKAFHVKGYILSSFYCN